VYTTGGRIYDMSVLADDAIVVETTAETFGQPFVMNVNKLTATGDRDLTFNPTGPIPGVLTIDDSGPAWLVPQIDGTFLLMPHTAPARMYRLTAGGTLDLTFGAGTGLVHIADAHSDEQVWGVAPDGPDRLVVQLARGSPAGTASLVRIGRDGVTDPAFGTAGRVELARLGADYIDPFFVQSDHRIIVEVRRLPHDVALARLTADGLLDGSFNPGSANPGWLLVDPGPDDQHRHEIIGLAEVADGKLLAAGHRLYTLGVSTDVVAEIYRFNGFPGAPRPTALAPMPSWPIIAVNSGAIALAVAERLAVVAP
jgi:hypothetical protein